MISLPRSLSMLRGNAVATVRGAWQLKVITDSKFQRTHALNDDDTWQATGRRSFCDPAQNFSADSGHAKVAYLNRVTGSAQHCSLFSDVCEHTSKRINGRLAFEVRPERQQISLLVYGRKSRCQVFVLNGRKACGSCLHFRTNESMNRDWRTAFACIVWWIVCCCAFVSCLAFDTSPPTPVTISNLSGMPVAVFLPVTFV